MLRMTKQADYAIVLLTYMARRRPGACFNARDLAAVSHLGLPIVSKILKLLTRGEVLDSQRGVKGGYRLARSPELIQVGEIIEAVEGPIAITECTDIDGSDCATESLCPVRGHWQRINQAIVEALEGITLAEMTDSVGLGNVRPPEAHPV